MRQVISHCRSLFQYLHLYQAQVYLLLQFKLLAMKLQAYHIQSHQWILIMILALYQHMYQVRFHTEHRVFYQVLFHPRSLVQYLFWDQAQVHLLIKVNLPERNPQGCHLQYHQWILLRILALYHPMY